jgi:hypothetical protein
MQNYVQRYGHSQFRNLYSIKKYERNEIKKDRIGTPTT